MTPGRVGPASSVGYELDGDAAGDSIGEADPDGADADGAVDGTEMLGASLVPGVDPCEQAASNAAARARSARSRFMLEPRCEFLQAGCAQPA